MARKKKLFKIREPKVKLTGKGLKVTKPTARIGGKAGLNLSSNGVSAGMRTRVGTASTRSGVKRRRGNRKKFIGLL